jgi:hypothetical protein
MIDSSPCPGIVANSEIGIIALAGCESLPGKVAAAVIEAEVPAL